MFEEIIDPISPILISKEIETLNKHILVRLKNIVAYSANAKQIPYILQEIGRLREITYRDVSEGTGKSVDLDKYDQQCEHIFIWDEKEKKIVGAYRILNGKKTLNEFGLHGFYIHTLFHINEQLCELLSASLELGRSFIIKEYQRKPSPLFALWKALLYSIIKSDARYLIGPVSISGKYSEEAKSITLWFLMENFYQNEIAQFIEARNKYPISLPKEFNKDLFNKEVGQDFSKLDKYIWKYEQGYHTPILVRQYISLLNTKAIGFNIDPLFNNCLDVLMLMDLTKAPKQTIENLAKDYPNPSDIYEKLCKIKQR